MPFSPGFVSFSCISVHIYLEDSMEIMTKEQAHHMLKVFDDEMSRALDEYEYLAEQQDKLTDKRRKNRSIDHSWNHVPKRKDRV